MEAPYCRSRGRGWRRARSTCARHGRQASAEGRAVTGDPDVHREVRLVLLPEWSPTGDRRVDERG
jgi:hypothetical protein